MSHDSIRGAGRGRLSVLMVSTMAHERLRAHAAQIEELGYDGVWYADERFHHEPYVGLTAMALATSRISLGVGVADPYTRHPALVAAAINSLDELSRGRAILGYGAGVVGLDNLGLKLDRPARAMREGIDIIRALWTGDTVTYAGELLSITEGRMQVPARADIPVCVAADGPYTLRLAGEIGDAVMIPHCRSPLLLQSKLAFVAEGAKRAGRPNGPRVIARLDTTVASDSREALEGAKARLGRLMWWQFPHIRYLEMLDLPLPADLEKRLRDAGPFVRTQDLDTYRRFVDVIPDELVHPIMLAGSPSEVWEQIEQLYEYGVDEVTMLPVPPRGATPEGMVQLLADAGIRVGTLDKSGQ